MVYSDAGQLLFGMTVAEIHASGDENSYLDLRIISGFKDMRFMAEGNLLQWIRFNSTWIKVTDKHSVKQ